MAPRAPESLPSFLARLDRALADGAREVRFGRHHFSHVVCVEAGGYSVRQLVLDDARAKAALEATGRFMPEDAEVLSEPGPVLFEASSLEALHEALRSHRGLPFA